MEKTRILWIDFTKAIVMVLVIIGHSGVPSILYGAINSFHMPLFFFLSGYTTKCSETKQQVCLRLKKTAKWLLIPAYSLWIIRLVIYLLIGRVNYSLPQIILSAIWAGGEEYTIAGFTIPAMGMTWFLVTLFILRNTYDFLQFHSKKNMTLISVCATILGITVGLWFQLPFNLDLVLFSFAFYHCGQFLSRNAVRVSAPKFAVSAILWGGVLIVEYITSRTCLGMTSRRYPILCITCALAGCLLCIYVCQLLCKIMPNIFMRPIYEMGQYSILLFAVHYMDGIWYPLIEDMLIEDIMNIYIALIIRLLIDVCLFFIILYIKRTVQQRKENPEKPHKE